MGDYSPSEEFDEVSARECLSVFVETLRDALARNPHEWETLVLQMLLEAISAWTCSISRLDQNVGDKRSKNPGCKKFAEILLGAKIYE